MLPHLLWAAYGLWICWFVTATAPQGAQSVSRRLAAVYLCTLGGAGAGVLLGGTTGFFEAGRRNRVVGTTYWAMQIGIWGALGGALLGALAGGVAGVDLRDASWFWRRGLASYSLGLAAGVIGCNVMVAVYRPWRNIGICLLQMFLAGPLGLAVMTVVGRWGAAGGAVAMVAIAVLLLSRTVAFGERLAQQALGASLPD